ncbi:glycosyl hydrolase [Aspergillus californicus]
MAHRNPIIPGFAPDPSVIRIENTFYLVNSSFHLYPGLPIFASRDLVSWRHIGNAIQRPTQLSLAQSATTLNPGPDGSREKAPATGGLYAPAIRHHQGKTYIVCTNVIYDAARDTGDWASGLSFQNFIVSTSDIGVGQWSDPVFFDFHGIDPDLFFDDNGLAYVAGSSWTPSPSCCIACFEIDIHTGRKLSKETVLWAGYSQVIPEGPHIYKRSGYYYLLIAEGGTHEGHCITIARATSIWGPYESSDANPILKPTVELDPAVYGQYNGHGDLVQDLHGSWWLVCLAVRRDRAGRMVLGRETFLTAVEWPESQIWPRIQQPIPRTIWGARGTPSSEDGDADAFIIPPSRPVEAMPSPLSPRMDLVWIRDPDLKRCRISVGDRMISLQPSRTDLGQCTGDATSFVGRRQRRLEGSATACLVNPNSNLPLSESDDALGDVVRVGLAYYKDEHRYARIMYEPRIKMVTFEEVNRAKDPPLSGEKKLAVDFTGTTKLYFRILYTEKLIHFLYQADDRGWRSCGLIDTLQMTGHDFTGPVIGVFATGAGEDWYNFEEVDI